MSYISDHRKLKRAWTRKRSQLNKVNTMFSYFRSVSPIRNLKIIKLKSSIPLKMRRSHPIGIQVLSQLSIRSSNKAIVV